MEILNFITQYLHVDNIKKSWQTTVLGVFLIIAGFVSKFVPIGGQVTSWSEALFPIILGILLCFSHNNPLNPKAEITTIATE